MKKAIIYGAGVAVAGAFLVWIGMVIFEDPHVAEGRTLFQYYCAHCHGAKGRGDGYNSDFMDPRPRDLTDRIEEYMGPASNEEIFDVVSRVIKEEEEVTDPDEFWVPGAMPTFKQTLSEKEIWSLVAFIRTLHSHDFDDIEFTEEMNATRPSIRISGQITLATLSSAKLDTLAAEGKRLYEDKFICLSCHRIGKEGGMVGPDLSRSGVRLNPSWVYRWTIAPQSIRHETKMPSFGMSEDEALAITVYLSTLREMPLPPPEVD